MIVCVCVCLCVCLIEGHIHVQKVLGWEKIVSHTLFQSNRMVLRWLESKATQ